MGVAKSFLRRLKQAEEQVGRMGLGGDPLRSSLLLVSFSGFFGGLVLVFCLCVCVFR